jgi:hypothetical protein
MQFGRRSFFALASGLLAPWQPERVYSFLPAWRLLPRPAFDDIASAMVVALPDQCPDKYYMWGNTNVINPANLLDVQKSAEAYGIQLRMRDAETFGRTDEEWAAYRRVQEFYGHAPGGT